MFIEGEGQTKAKHTTHYIHISQEILAVHELCSTLVHSFHPMYHYIVYVCFGVPAFTLPISVVHVVL